MTNTFAMKNKFFLRLAFLLLLALVATLALRAQTSTPAKLNILRPPMGAKVALIEFADLQCPDCARAAALLEDAVKAYKIPLVVYDFPLPMHPWAMDAAIYAHHFRNLSTPKNPLEADFRRYIYENQSAVTPANLRSFVDKFAKEHKLTVPLVIDPAGSLAASVRRYKDKGIAINIEHTPTIYVVTAHGSSGAPFVEVVDRNNLFNMIDQALADTRNLPAAKSTATPAAKKTKK